MKKFNLLGILLVINFFEVANAQLCYPMNFGGIVPGITLDRDVIALYGLGFYDPTYGHNGGRIFTDSKLSVTFIVEIGVDNYIESVWIKKGLEFPDSVVKQIKKYVTDNFEITNNGKLRTGLGSTKEMITSAYGSPTSISESGNIWNYEPEPHNKTCYIETSINFWFTDNTVTAIVIGGDGD
jgi:hypothetical protein